MDPTFGKICRLCLKNSHDVITLFSDFSTELHIAEIIEKHFWFKVDKNDNFSNNICRICWYNVETFHKFYNEVKLMHDNLNSSRYITEYENHPSFENDVKPVISFENDEDDLSNTESFDQSDIELPPLRQKPAKHKKCGPKKKPTETKITKSNSDGIDELNISKQESNEKRHEEDQRIREFYNLKCDLCNIQSNTFIEVRAHYRVQHKIRRGYLTCCRRKFFYRGEILEHMFWHLNPDAFKCTVCSKSYPTKWKLDLHMHYHAPDNEKIYCCDICDRRYSKKCQVKQHIYLIHAFRKELKCDQCDKLFRLNSQLMAHIRNVHENANQRMCDICAKVFKSKFQSDLHRRTEHPINGEAEKFQCTQCGTCVKHHRALRRHMLRHHSEIKNYTCDQCEKVVKTKDALRSHIRHVHESHPAKHKCDICGKAFHKLLILREHIATHTGAILYRCDWCSKPFRSIANKYSHLRKVHPIEWEQNRALRNVNKPVIN